MADMHDEEGTFFFESTMTNTSPIFPGQAFDDLFPDTPATNGVNMASPAYLNPTELSFKNQAQLQTVALPTKPRATSSRSPADSPETSSQSSSSGSSTHHDPSFSNNPVVPDAYNGSSTSSGAGWGSGVQGYSMPAEDAFFPDTDMTSMGTDFETGNEQMASAFDFDTAASTPSGFGNSAAVGSIKPELFRESPKYVNPLMAMKNTSPHATAGNGQFFFGSREPSPLNAMLPAQERTPWSKHSPSSGLEETFNGITMNGQSPQNPTFSPNLHFPGNAFSFDTADSSARPSSLAKQDFASPPSTMTSASDAAQVPILSVNPTSLKSRVETQIPIKMTLFPFPPGATKLRLPTHTVSKPKFLAKPETQKSDEILELTTSLVCTSAMQDPQKRDRAFARARGEEVGRLAVSTPGSSTDSPLSKDDEDKPLDGGEVRICTGCIQRERKRASRKKQKKPDEDELFQKDEERRVIVFNTNELKDWAEPTKNLPPGVPGAIDPAQPVFPTGAMQVDLPMRIACYCRHQNEKIGFQVIFTVKDHTGKAIAQAMTNSIMITDDHKTHAAPPPTIPPPATLPDGLQLPGAGVFASGSGVDTTNGGPMNRAFFKQSHSTTDLQGLQHNFNPQFPMTPASNPFALPQPASTNTSATLTPRNLSRPASPSGTHGPTTKRRKQSGSGKVPSNLTMTRLETSQSHSNGAATAPTTTTTSPFGNNMGTFVGPLDRGYALPNTLPGPFGTSPPTPNSNDTFFTAANRSLSMENLSNMPIQQLLSAPSSAHPSRPGSPGGSNLNSFGESNVNLGQAVSNSLYSITPRRPSPIIHKLVPAEGSVAGGTEVTLLGNGFYQGLEVMFGDTLATTTTFWGDKCLNCITPPAIQPGTVSVLLKHDPQLRHIPTQQRHIIYTYVDDREVELYRLALKTLGKQMPRPTEDPYNTAQMLLGGSSQNFWGMQNSAYGQGGGQQRQIRNSESEPIDLIELEVNLLKFLECVDQGPSRTSLNLRRPTGHTLLHLASSLGLTRFVSLLLARGANPDMLDNNGNTPMHLAALSGHSHIVHRLRIAGANPTIRSLRNFTPADIATSLLAHQAAVIPAHHYRSRSAGSTPMQLHSRNTSSTSLKSFWDTASMAQGYSEDSEENDSDLDEATEAMSRLENSMAYLRSSRRSSVQAEISRPGACTPSRRSSAYHVKSQTTLAASQPAQEVHTLNAPAAAMIAWRDQLAAQIQQFQQSVNWTLPNLPTLPPMPTLPDPQAYPVVRRVSSLLPHRPASRAASSPPSKDRWWEMLTGTSSNAPPAYEDLYPEHDTEDNVSTKKASAVQAATDAALDQHFDSTASQASASTSAPAITKVKIGKHPFTEEQRNQIRLAHAQKVKGLKSDRTLFWFWVSPLCRLAIPNSQAHLFQLPVLIVLVALMVLDVRQVTSQGYQYLHSQYLERVVEVI